MEYCLLADTLTTVEAIFAKMIITHYTLRESKVRHTARLTKMKGEGDKTEMERAIILMDLL